LNTRKPIRAILFLIYSHQVPAEPAAMKSNQGFDPEVVLVYKEKCARNGFGFVQHPEEERTPEYAHVYFTAPYENREVIFDTVFYTLRLQHESELLQIAEEMAMEKFPGYRGVEEEEDGDGEEDGQPGEIAMFMGEVILSLEEEETVMVQEHADIDPEAEFGVGLDVGLHVEEISDDTISAFIQSYKAKTVRLDPTLYFFRYGDSADD